MTEPPAEASPALGLYVHWPFCARICPYCDFNVALDRRPGQAAALAAAVVQDLRAQAGLIGSRQLVSIFFGGGTPSLMDPAWVAAIIEAAKASWPAGPNLEITLEANPTDAEAGRFAAFAGAGVTRLSLGVQALNDADLRFLGRDHDVDEARRAAALAARTFARLSIDLIYARPGQTPAQWAEELKAAIDWGAEHISPYPLTIEPGTPFDRAARRKAFTPPDADHGAALYETTQAVLAAAGFDAYEVSNHARGLQARARHNLVYWRGEDYLGVGPGAHGRLTADGARTATQTFDAIGAYLAAVHRTGFGLREQVPLSPVEAAEERLLMGLRTDEGVLLDELQPLPMIKLADLTRAGLVRADGARLHATRSGRPLLDRVIAELAGG